MSDQDKKHNILIYGATGYTGQLTARLAKQQGLHPILAGRNGQKVKSLAQEMLFEHRVVDLHNHSMLKQALQDVKCVLHMAGPFSATSRPMLDACLATNTHYVDITGEIEVFENCAQRDAEAKRRGLMVLPGAGFDVVPSDCLAKYVADVLPGAISLTLAISGGGHVSRGTAKTAMEVVGLKPFVRRGGRLVRLNKPSHREFDFGSGLTRCVNVSWGDVASAYYSTGIPDIEVLFPSSAMLERSHRLNPFVSRLLRTDLAQHFIRQRINKRPEGPTEEQRRKARAVLIAEAADGKRNKIAARLITPDGYTLTAATALAIAQRIQQDDYKPGFQTPALAYGADFILQFDHVSRQDITL